MVDRVLTIVMYLALYGYMGYKVMWFHWVVTNMPAQLRISGL